MPAFSTLKSFGLPEAYHLRDSLVLDVKQWQARARARFKETDKPTSIKAEAQTLSGARLS